jgi:hypothetical protein
LPPKTNFLRRIVIPSFSLPKARFSVSETGSF